MTRQPAFIGDKPPTKSISSMSMGEEGWTSTNAYIVEIDPETQAQRYYIEDSMPYSPVKDGNMNVKIRKLGMGYKVDLSEVS